MAMSERDTDYSVGTQNSVSSAGTDNPAVPDTAKSTAEFRAFAHRTSETESPWNMKAPGRKIILLVAAVVVVAIVLAVVAIAVLNA
jgi:anti-sigma-K factor RskA